MHIVLDSNILARAVAAPQGPAGELLDRIRSPHALVTSSELLTELARVLTYDRVRQLHGLNDDAIERFLERVEAASFAVATPPESVPVIVPHDPDDNFVIAAAIVGKADVICTRDRHLLHADVQTHCSAHGIRIMDDIALLRLLRQETTNDGDP